MQSVIKHHGNSCLISRIIFGVNTNGIVNDVDEIAMCDDINNLFLSNII